MEDRLVRLNEIVGDKKNGIKGILPISKSGWWSGVASGRFPKSVKIGPRTTCWRLSDVAKLLE